MSSDGWFPQQQQTGWGPAKTRPGEKQEAIADETDGSTIVSGGPAAPPLT